MIAPLPKLPRCISTDKDHGLLFDGLVATELAEEFGTPSYFYSAKAIRDNYAKFKLALTKNLSSPWRIFYAYKGNSSPAVCKILHNQGAGAEVVSMGEMLQALMLGVHPNSIIFNNIVKTDEEIEYALRANIDLIIVDSETEIDAISRIASSMGIRADIGFRVRPSITAGFHSHVSTGHDETKFGFSLEALDKIVGRASNSKYLNIKAIQTHIGSQICDIEKFLKAADILFELTKELRSKFKVPIEIIDLGGGIGIQGENYDRVSFEFDKLVTGLEERLETIFNHESRPILYFEPNRAMVADTSILLGRIISIKKDVSKIFVGTDIGYSSFIRCMLYGAFHDIRNTKDPWPKDPVVCEIVGPICETGDVLGKNRPIAQPEVGNVLALLDAGSYGYAQSSQYNGRPRPAEILVDNGQPFIIRHAEMPSEILGRFEIPSHIMSQKSL